MKREIFCTISLYLLSCYTMVLLFSSCGNSAQKNQNTADSVYADSSSFGTTEGNNYEGYTLNTSEDNDAVDGENEYQTPESSSTVSTSNIYGEVTQQTSDMVDEESTGSPYPNYKETSFNVNGIVVYEGRNDFYIVRSNASYTVLYRKSGPIYEGSKIRGDLKHWGTQYIINQNYDSEVEVYIEDYAISEGEAYRWLGNHGCLKSEDQELYDVEN